MRVNYTLPGLLPDASATDAGDRPAMLFSEHLQLLRAPEFTDWRTLLRLNAPPAGLAGIDTPKTPHGVDSRDAASQRAWWRAMLQKHQGPLDSDGGEALSNCDSTLDPSVRRMLDWLTESQRHEDEIFARHFREAED
ncbi:MAG TPA: hypothetical protein VKE70_34345 [Candidatus Solibacter sp.]|nr:hypothetical protein [Candidatus Solibacter sp.]